MQPKVVESERNIEIQKNVADSRIKEAEGAKQSAILESEGKAEAARQTAKGAAEATRLAASGRLKLLWPLLTLRPTL